MNDHIHQPKLDTIIDELAEKIREQVGGHNTYVICRALRKVEEAVIQEACQGVFG